MPSILVVDDSEVDRRIVGGLLEKQGGHQIRYARNGREAITQLRQAAPDLVVTDMQMPERDGLELVRAIRLHYSQVPVVLVTAHGSDEVAIKALEEGAAGYVAKSQLGDRLVDTVDELLAITRADRSYTRLIGCLERTVFQFSLDNDPGLLDPLVDLVQQIVSGMKLCETNDRYRVGVALKAALTNALFRGNLELTRAELESARDGVLEGPEAELVERRRNQAPYCDRRIAVHVELDAGVGTIVVRDEGPGFDVATALAGVPAEAVVAASGRGLVLMRAFLDEVRFNDQGNEVTLTIRRI